MMKFGKRSLRIMISVPSLLFWVAVAMFDHTLKTAAALTAAAFHECGHLIAMKCCKMDVTGLCVLPYGVEMTSGREPRSFWEDMIISSAGCVANLLTAPLLYCFGAVTCGDIGEFFLLTAASSAVLCAVNAMPIATLDGGCVLAAVFESVLSPEKAYRLSMTVSFLFLIALWVLATYVFMFSGYNYSMFAMVIWLFVRIFCQK